MNKYVVSWSGGKDSCLAHWMASSQGMRISYLLHFVETKSERSMSHGLDSKLIALQAQAMNLPILQNNVTWESYEAEFKSALEKLKLQGIIGVVTGDIYLQGHKDWIDRVCGEADMAAVLPLWGIDTTQLLSNFINAGFKAIVVSVKAEFFDKDWLGRQLDSNLIDELGQLARTSNIDPCGEAGEFHTFVYDGPSFVKPIIVDKTEQVLRDDRWFLDIKEYRLGC